MCSNKNTKTGDFIRSSVAGAYPITSPLTCPPPSNLVIVPTTALLIREPACCCACTKARNAALSCCSTANISTKSLCCWRSRTRSLAAPLTKISECLSQSRINCSWLISYKVRLNRTGWRNQQTMRPCALKKRVGFWNKSNYTWWRGRSGLGWYTPRRTSYSNMIINCPNDSYSFRWHKVVYDQATATGNRGRQENKRRKREKNGKKGGSKKNCHLRTHKITK